MLNQPINVIPSVLSGVGEGVIDANRPLAVSWQVSGDTPMVAYRVVIQQNDTSSTQVFSTGKLGVDGSAWNPSAETHPVFYPTDRNGNPQTFIISPITAAQLSSAGVVNGYANGYKIIITQWWGSATPSESIEQTSPSYFITRKTPTISISLPSYTLSNPYTSKDITINASFAQEQGDTVKTVRWYLYEGQQANKSNLLLDTGDIETQLLQLYYDGMFPSTYYYIVISAQTSSGVTVSASATIYVNYALGESVGNVDVCKPYGQNFIEVSWSARSSIDGIASGEVTYDNGFVHIEDGDEILYNPLNISNPWSITWRGSANISDNAEITIVQFGSDDDEYTLSLAHNAVSFKLNGNIIFSKETDCHSSDTFTIVITPTHYYIRQDTFYGGTIPAETLYPENTLYPSDSTDVVNHYDGTITYTQTYITYLVLNGDQSCDYIWIESGELSQSEIDQIVGDEYYEPIAEYNTMFLSGFDMETTTAYMSGSGGNGLGSAVYRKEQGKSVLEHVVDAAGGVSSIRDYGAKARTQYQYYVFAIGSSVYTEVFGSGSIVPQYNNYTLMECVYDKNDGAYHVQAAYPFACNTSQSALSTNNSPNIMRNFTRYPNRQPVNALYSSGTLTSLIGSVNQENASYSDSWKIADDIIELSISNNPKFLRDMKGKIWRVETAEAITTEVSTSNVFMPIKITIPWVEVGSADGASIVAVPSDPVYINDMIILTSIDIDIANGQLVWTTPENYDGTILTINGVNLEAYTPINVYPANLEINSENSLIANE